MKLLFFDQIFARDTFINFLGAFFGFGLSLLIYLHQIRRERKKELIVEIDNRRKLLVYYKELIKKFKEIANANLNLLNEYIISQEDNLTNLLPLQRKPSNDFVRLINVDNKGVFQAWTAEFIASESVKDYQQANSALDVLNGVVNEVHRMHNHVIEHSSIKMFEVKEIVEGIPDKLSTISFELAKDLKEARYENSYFLFIDQQIGIYYKMVGDGVNISVIMSDFIKPLLVGIHKDFAGHVHALEIMILCKKCRVKFHDVEVDIERMLEEFKTIPDKVAKSNEILDLTLAKLEIYR